MTLIEWVAACWNRATAVAKGKPVLYAIQRPTPAVPAEWLSLYTYLEHRYATTVVLTFAQVESLLGRALPEAARTERGWWTDADSPPDRGSDAWTKASRTATPNLLARTIVFERLP
jgi:hypothetical protein